MNCEASQISGGKAQKCVQIPPGTVGPMLGFGETFLLCYTISVPKVHPAFPVRDFETVDDRFVHKHGMI
jgi:hypothetical protein